MGLKSMLSEMLGDDGGPPSRPELPPPAEAIPAMANYFSLHMANGVLGGHDGNGLPHPSSETFIVLVSGYVVVESLRFALGGGSGLPGGGIAHFCAGIVACVATVLLVLKYIGPKTVALLSTFTIPISALFVLLSIISEAEIISILSQLSTFIIAWMIWRPAKIERASRSVSRSVIAK